MTSAQTLGILQRVVRKTSCRAVVCILWWRLWDEAFCVTFWPTACFTSSHWRLFSAGFFLCVLMSSGEALLVSGSPVIKLFLFMRWDILCWCNFCCSGGRNWISCIFLGLQFEESQDRVQVPGKCWFLSAWRLWADRVSLLTYRELAQRRIHIHSSWDGFLILLVFFELWYVFRSSHHIQRNLYLLLTWKQSVGNQGIWIS